MDLLSNAKDQNSSKKEGKNRMPSARFTLSLKTIKEDECPEFSYLELLQEDQKKNKKNGDAKNDEIAGRSEAEAMARYFEEKYGGGGGVVGSKAVKRKRRDRIQDLADVGYGYDETDPFVDNSEYYDEVVPSSMTTQFGGFYINSGKLEFKHISDESDMEEDDEDSLPLSAHMKKKLRLHSDSDEKTFFESNGISKKQHIKKRKVSMERTDKRTRKLSLQGKDKLVKLAKGPKKKPTKVQLLVAKAKAQHHLNAADKLSASKQGNNSNSNHKSMNGAQPPTISETGLNLLDFIETQDKVLKISDFLPAIDIDQDSNSDDITLSKICKATNDTKLPHTIPSTIKDKITSLTKIAKSNENEGKVKFFSPHVNDLLLGIEASSQALSNRERSGIYQHLTPHVPCSKDTLIKRMKKLHASKQDESVRKPLQLLKQAIDEIMEEQIYNYDEECAAQQLAKMDDRIALAASTDEDDDGSGLPQTGEERTKRSYAPRKKFKWNEKIRTLLFDVIRVKVKQFETVKSKQNHSAEEYLKNFLETEVKVLWPKGWMQVRMLYKESRDIHQCITGHQPKQKKVIVPTNKKSVGNKTDKKAPPINHHQNNVTSFHTTQPGLSTKPVIQESGMSINLSIDSDPTIEKTHPPKELSFMNRINVISQNEGAQIKVSRPQEPAGGKQTTTSRQDIPQRKVAQIKLTDIAKNNMAQTKSKSQSLYKMLGTMDDDLESTKEHVQDAHRAVKTWNEARKPKSGSSYNHIVANPLPQKTVSSDVEKDPAPHGQKSSSVPASMKLQQKKAAAKSTPKVPVNMNQLEFGAELVKLAMLAPSGSGHIMPPMYNPGLLPTSTKTTSMDKLVKWQQAAMPSHLQPAHDSFKAYLASLSTGPMLNNTLYPGAASPVKPKHSLGTKTVSSANTSSSASTVNKDRKSHHRSHVPPSQSDFKKSPAPKRIESVQTASSERGKKHYAAPTSLSGNHSASSAANYSNNSPSNSSYSKSTFSLAIKKPSSQPPRSNSTSVSLKKEVSPSSKSFTTPYPPSTHYASTHYGNRSSPSSLNMPTSTSFKLQDVDVKNYRNKVSYESSPFIPLPSDRKSPHDQAAAMEALLAAHHQLNTGNNR